MNYKRFIKKLVFSFVLVVTILLYQNVYAAGASIRASKTSVTVGEAVTITVSYSAEAWDLYLSGSINDSEVGYSMNGITNGSRSWTLNTSTVGSYTVTLSGTISYTDGNGQDHTDSVGNSVTVVVNKAPDNPTPDPTPTPTPTPTPNTNPSTAGDNRSTNANLKSFTVENFQIVKKDDTHYSLEVSHSIEKIKIQATCEDSKATVKGTGEVSLNIGSNSFQVVVTAENGSTKTYVLDVVRRSNEYSMDNIEDALKDSDNVVIVLKEDDVITKNNFEKIKELKKEVEFVRQDENKKVLYSLVVEGEKLDHIEEDVKPNAKFTFDDVEEFDELAGYRKGIYFQFVDQSKFPTGISIKIPVGNEYKDGDKVQLYIYDAVKKKIELVQKDVKVESGVVKIGLKNASNYFLTKANINSSNGESYKLAAIVEFVFLLIMTGFLVFFAIRNRKPKQEIVPEMF